MDCYFTPPPPNRAPSGLTPEVQKNIVSAVAQGAYLKTAADFAGVTEWQLYTWLEMAEDEGPGDPHYELRQAINQAASRLEIRLGQSIIQAAEDDWKAASKFLEQRFPERWGRKEISIKPVKQSMLTASDIEAWPLEKRQSLFQMISGSQMKALTPGVTDQTPEIIDVDDFTLEEDDSNG